jgi:sugar lactone lactonase YvrE
MTLVNGELWVWDVDQPDLFYVLDPEDGTVLANYASPVTGGATGLAFDGQFVWGVSSFQSGPPLTPPLLVRMDPADGSVVQSYDLPVPHPSGITFDGEHLWVSDFLNDGLMVKIDPITGGILESFSKSPGRVSCDLAWDGEFLWRGEVEYGANGFIYSIARVDAQTGQTVAFYDPPGVSAAGLAVSGSLLFVSDPATDMIYALAIPEPTSLICMLAVAARVCVRARRGTMLRSYGEPV